MNLKDYKTWIVLVVLLGAGYTIGRYAQPAKVITKTEVKTVTQEVIKTVEVDKTNYYKDKTMVETITTKPDGTTIKQRKFVDKSVIIVDDEKNTSSQTNSSTTNTTSTEKVYSTQNGSVKFLYARNINNLSNEIYGLEVDKRLIGPFSLGIFGLTDKTLGLGLGVNF